MPTAALNGITINYEAHGSGTPLVLAHGYTASLNMWRQQVPAFSSRYRVVIYDTRGHGRTTAPVDQDGYDLARDYVADQLALMDHLAIEGAFVGGLSMGGMIAQEFALQHPERLKALLLFDTGPGGGSRDPATAARFEQFRALMTAAARSKGMSAVVEMMRSSAGAAMSRRDPVPEPVREHLRGMAEMSVDGYLGGARAMQAWRGSVDRLPSIKVPTLVLAGENDNLLGPSRAIHQRIAGARFVLLRNAAHGTNMWRPKAFERATLDFLAAVEGGADVAGEFEL